MGTLTEKLHACAPIVSEANGYRSRSVATIPASTAIVVGMVLGKLNDKSGHVPLNPAANSGAEVAAAVALYDVTTPANRTAKTTVFDCDGELRASDLTWPAGISAQDKAEAVDQLRALGIKLV